VSDGNVAFERGGGVAHSFNCTPTFQWRIQEAMVRRPLWSDSKFFKIIFALFL